MAYELDDARERGRSRVHLKSDERKGAGEWDQGVKAVSEVGTGSVSRGQRIIVV